MKDVKRSGRSGARVKRRYLSRGEVARLFEVSPATVARWAREGRLPHVSTLGGHRRYRANEIQVILEKVAGARMPDRNRRRGPS
ncbi:MAG: helix-turn-helix domain-containing protein [candidate division NC10 bacterium]